MQAKLELASKLPPNPQSSPEIRYDGKTVIITGAGAGLGRAYAHMYGRLGANVVINDVSEKGANAVVAEVEQGMLTRQSPLHHDFDALVDQLVGKRLLSSVRQRMAKLLSGQHWTSLGVYMS